MVVLWFVSVFKIAYEIAEAVKADEEKRIEEERREKEEKERADKEREATVEKFTPNDFDIPKNKKRRNSV